MASKEKNIVYKMDFNKLKVEAKSKNIMDEPIPEINIPILKPTSYRFKPPSLKSIASKATNLVKEKINNFSDWIISYVPKSIFKVTDERVELLKEDIKDIYENENKKIESEVQLIKRKSKVRLLDSALKGYLKTYRISGIKNEFLLSFLNQGVKADRKIIEDFFSWINFLNIYKNKVIKTISKENKPIKLKLILTCVFSKYNPETKKTSYNYGYFHTKNEVITESTDLNELYSIAIENFTEKIEKFANLGSGWVFDKVEYLDIHINPINPLGGS